MSAYYITPQIAVDALYTYLPPTQSLDCLGTTFEASALTQLYMNYSYVKYIYMYNINMCTKSLSYVCNIIIARFIIKCQIA